MLNRIKQKMLKEISLQGYHLLVKVAFRTTEVPRKIL